MCGIIGIVANDAVAHVIYDALLVLQHRGQDSAGIVTCEGNYLTLRKNNGQVSDVFQQKHMCKLVGNMGIGHVRYPTAGCSSSAEAQPFYVNSPYGISLAHNGNLTNVAQLKDDVYKQDLRHTNTHSDSEVLLNVFAHELQASAGGKLNPGVGDVFDAVKNTHQRIKGAYAVIAMITGRGIVGFRDPYGIRPMVYGKRVNANGKAEYMVASESVALQACGFELEDDVKPGEAVYIGLNGEIHIKQCVDAHELKPCIFEYVYLARPDSIIDNIYVYKARLRMGVKLAEKILTERPKHDIDVVIPIPDTSRPSAMELAYHLGVKFREGFIKNRYIGRTFIMPGQKLRKKSVRRKLNPIDIEFKGKNVLLVDDSIVRGTTSSQIIQMAREAGANKVYMASAAPPVRFPNVYGIDMPSVDELIAHGRSEEEVGKEIGADWMIYQNLDDLIASVAKGNKNIKEFDCSCFTGNYVTGDVTPEYLSHIESLRSDDAKGSDGEKQEGDVGLHNS
ncbi:MAG: amidophosphoribosyltransferase [Gammaproteobacteria bacterium]|nr:amidophosphoribosyltransferase [Gammaproteobacteria bacterium]